MLENEELQQSLINLSTEDAVDLDPLLDQGRNIDWKTGGIRRAEFVSCYHDFIENCAGKHLPSEVSHMTLDTGHVICCVTGRYEQGIVPRYTLFWI